MANTTFDFTDIPFFNSLVKDYLSGELASDFYGEQANLEGFKNQIEKVQFSKSKREVLVASLKQRLRGTGYGAIFVERVWPHRAHPSAWSRDCSLILKQVSSGSGDVSLGRRVH